MIYGLSFQFACSNCELLSLLTETFAIHTRNNFTISVESSAVVLSAVISFILTRLVLSYFF